jgi:hypothetical protein
VRWAQCCSTLVGVDVPVGGAGGTGRARVISRSRHVADGRWAAGVRGNGASRGPVTDLRARSEPRQGSVLRQSQVECPAQAPASTRRSIEPSTTEEATAVRAMPLRLAWERIRANASATLMLAREASMPLACSTRTRLFSAV